MDCQGRISSGSCIRLLPRRNRLRSCRYNQEYVEEYGSRGVPERHESLESQIQTGFRVLEEWRGEIRSRRYRVRGSGNLDPGNSLFPFLRFENIRLGGRNL